MTEFWIGVICGFFGTSLVAGAAFFIFVMVVGNVSR